MSNSSLSSIPVIEGFDGFLFIGDPHMASLTPGSRMDACFSETVGQKIKQAAAIANTHNLYPVFLGDLLNRKDDHQPQMLCHMIECLKAFRQKPLSIIGNHEKNHYHLTTNDVMMVLKVAGLLDTLEGSQVFAKFILPAPTSSPKSKASPAKTRMVWLGGTQHGYPIPESLEHLLKKNGETELYQEHQKQQPDLTIWLTHHDLKFGTYPFNDPQELTEIPGIDMVVNGHIHSYYDSVTHGGTIWHNPGNITRMTYRDKKHFPRVWECSGEGLWKKKLKPHKLKYKEDIFKTRVIARSVEEAAAAGELPDLTPSFVTELKKDSLNTKTQDASGLRESVTALILEHAQMGFGQAPAADKDGVSDKSDKAAKENKQAGINSQAQQIIWSLVERIEAGLLVQKSQLILPPTPSPPSSP